MNGKERELKSKVKFRVKYRFEFGGEVKEGIEPEASWYLVDQQGNMYSYGPMKPIKPVNDVYNLCEPLLKIGNEWLSVEEIENRLLTLKRIIKAQAELLASYRMGGEPPEKILNYLRQHQNEIDEIVRNIKIRKEVQG